MLASSNGKDSATPGKNSDRCTLRPRLLLGRSPKCVIRFDRRDAHVVAVVREHRPGPGSDFHDVTDEPFDQECPDRGEPVLVEFSDEPLVERDGSHRRLPPADAGTVTEEKYDFLDHELVRRAD